MRRNILLLLTVSVLLAGCGKGSGADGAAAAASKDASTGKDASAARDASTANGVEADKADEGVKLDAEEVSKLGIQTVPAKAADFNDEVAGFGVIVSHDAIAQAVSEIDTAQATAKLSESALARARRLEGTPGAMSADAVDVLAQKAAVDNSALRLTRQKLSAVYGMNPPWSRPGGAASLEQTANGNSKLLRATFPLGTMPGQAPHRLRVRHLYANSAQSDWKLSTIWDAPADATAPGRSFFALVTASDAREGERVQVWAPVGESVAGVVIPKAAAVMSGGRFWCYVEKDDNAFERVELDPARLSGDDYFLSEGVEPGDRIVVAAAGQLLAKETGSSEAGD